MWLYPRIQENATFGLRQATFGSLTLGLYGGNETSLGKRGSIHERALFFLLGKQLATTHRNMDENHSCVLQITVSADYFSEQTWWM